MKKYYQVVVGDTHADIYIYGYITSDPWDETEVSTAPLVKEVDALNVQTINVYINSYGGEVAEALALVSALERSPAKVVTYCDGFACSAASIIFMAGEERMMSDASVLFVHNALIGLMGGYNAKELRKEADGVDTISETGIAVYRRKVTINDDELRQLMDEETWILPEDAVRMGFATGIVAENENAVASMDVRKRVVMRTALASMDWIAAADDAAQRIEPLLNKLQSLIQDADTMLTRTSDEDPVEAEERQIENTTTPGQFLMALLNQKEGPAK